MNRRDQPLIAGELHGLRVWPAVRRGRLHAMAYPVSWPDGGRALEATCQRRGAHRAPAARCACGIYGLHPGPTAARALFDAVSAEGEAVAGLIAAWGDVEVHESGFRAQYARPVALLLTERVSPLYARHVGALAAAYETKVLSVASATDIERYCTDRALGLTRSAVAELLAPALARERQARHVATRHARRSLGWVVALAGAAVELSRSNPSGAARRLRYQAASRH